MKLNLNKLKTLSVQSITMLSIAVISTIASMVALFTLPEILLLSLVILVFSVIWIYNYLKYIEVIQIENNSVLVDDCNVETIDCNLNINKSDSTRINKDMKTVTFTGKSNKDVISNTDEVIEQMDKLDNDSFENTIDTLNSDYQTVHIIGDNIPQTHMDNIQKELTKRGYLPRGPEVFFPNDTDIEYNYNLFVVDIDGYVSDSMKIAIEKAKKDGVKICYYSTSGIYLDRT